MFREFYPKDEECFTLLDCVWKTDKYVLIETLQNCESSKPLEENVSEDVTTKDSLVQYRTSVSSLGGKNLHITTSLVVIFSYLRSTYYLDVEGTTSVAHTCLQYSL